MPRLCCRKGKRPKRYKSNSSSAPDSEFVSASDWVLRNTNSTTTTTTNNNNNNSNNNTTVVVSYHNHQNMDLHVPSATQLPPLHSPPSVTTVSATNSTTTAHTTTTTTTTTRTLPVPPAPPSFLSPEQVASVPPPGLSAPSQPIFVTLPGPRRRRHRHGPHVNRTNTDPHHDDDDDDDDGNDDDERIILSYVAVQPKASSRISASATSGIRSYYRPLTTTTTTAAASGTTPAPSTYSISSHRTSTTTSSSSTSSKFTTTHSHHPATERVLLCCELTPGNPTSSTTSTPSSVPLLQWQSNLSHWLGRSNSTNQNNNNNNNMDTTTTTTPNHSSSISSSSDSNHHHHHDNNNTSKRRALVIDHNGSGQNSSLGTTSQNPTRVDTTTSSSHLATTNTNNTNNNNINNTPTLDPNERPSSPHPRRLHAVGPGPAGSWTQFHWATVTGSPNNNDNTPAAQQHVRLLIPARGSLYIQDGIDTQSSSTGSSSISSSDAASHPDRRTVQCRCLHDKSVTGMSATDAQLSPDGRLVAWTHEGEIYVQSAQPRTLDPSLLQQLRRSHMDTAVRLLDDSVWAAATSTTTPAVRISFGASQTESCCITHGVADFVAQEEMDRYRGFWWHPNSDAILFTRTDESEVPIYRIMHQSNSSALPSFSSSQQHTDHSSSQHYESNSSSNGLFATSKNSTNSAFEDHRYPFAGKMNPSVKLGLVSVDRESILELANTTKPNTLTTKSTSDCIERRDGIDCDETSGYSNDDDYDDAANDPMALHTAQDMAVEHWSNCLYFDAPPDVDEYLARVHIIPDGRAIAQWQNRSQTCTILYLLDLNHPPILDQSMGNAKGQILLVERSDVWINLHHMFFLLPRPIHPDECQQNDEMMIHGKNECAMPNPLPKGSFSFIFASEKTGYSHLYLYTFCPGVNNSEAVLIRSLTSGKWTVENIVGVDLEKDVVYCAGTFDSVLERHLYSIPLLNVKNKHRWRFGSYPTTTPPSSSETLVAEGSSVQSSAHPKLTVSDDNNCNHGGVRSGLSKVLHALSGKVNGSTTGNSICPTEHSEIFFGTRSESEIQCPTRLTLESGMHSIVMDEKCRYFVATSSDVDRPTTVKIYELPTADRMSIRWKATIYDAAKDDPFTSTNVPNEYKTSGISDMVKCLPAPELISFPTSDGTETLHAALYRPNPQLYGPGPYPLVCAVYGGPHVQRVNKSWSQSADMRAQRLRSLGFCVVKCDNRGSSRRGLSFESAIMRRLGRLEVLDQVAAVRQLVVRGIADPRRVGVYGWSYGGYLSAMCLCRAPDVFHVAVAGAPVTSWDGYDTHYTERYMGLPADNPSGYRESAVFDHVPNMRGKLMIVHGLIDENVHFRHTTRLINKLIAAGKDYDLLIFPEERHSPRRLRDRIYMEQRISEYFARYLSCRDGTESHISFASPDHSSEQGLRPMAGHL